MSNLKYLLILVVLIAIVYFGYYLLPRPIVETSGESFDENKCKELLIQHDSSIADMSFFTAGSDSHIDGSNGTTD